MKVNYLQQITYRHLPSDFRDRHAESVVTNPYWDLVEPDRMSTGFRDGLDEMMHAARALVIETYSSRAASRTRPA